MAEDKARERLKNNLKVLSSEFFKVIGKISECEKMKRRLLEDIAECIRNIDSDKAREIMLVEYLPLIEKQELPWVNVVSNCLDLHLRDLREFHDYNEVSLAIVYYGELVALLRKRKELIESEAKSIRKSIEDGISVADLRLARNCIDAEKAVDKEIAIVEGNMLHDLETTIVKKIQKLLADLSSYEEESAAKNIGELNNIFDYLDVLLLVAAGIIALMGAPLLLEAGVGIRIALWIARGSRITTVAHLIYLALKTRRRLSRKYRERYHKKYTV